MFTPLYVKSTLAAESIVNKCKSFIKDERGVTAVEYAIIAVAVSAIVLAVFSQGGLGKALGGAIRTVSSNISGAAHVTTGVK